MNQRIVLLLLCVACNGQTSARNDAEVEAAVIPPNTYVFDFTKVVSPEGSGLRVQFVGQPTFSFNLSEPALQFSGDWIGSSNKPGFAVPDDNYFSCANPKVASFSQQEFPDQDFADVESVDVEVTAAGPWQGEACFGYRDRLGIWVWDTRTFPFELVSSNLYRAHLTLRSNSLGAIQVRIQKGPVLLQRITYRVRR